VIDHLLLVATLATMAVACFVFLAAGWALGYLHKSLIEWGISAAYRRLLADVGRALLTGRWT
jgi:hypothetical protein